jgi:hypothetical protein
MIGNFDFYDSKFVDWCTACNALGVVKILLLNNSWGANVALSDRAKMCRSSKFVSEVYSVVGNKWETQMADLFPGLVFIEPNIQEGQAIEEVCVANGWKVMKTIYHQNLSKPTNLWF